MEKGNIKTRKWEDPKSGHHGHVQASFNPLSSEITLTIVRIMPVEAKEVTEEFLANFVADSAKAMVVLPDDPKEAEEYAKMAPKK